MEFLAVLFIDHKKWFKKSIWRENDRITSFTCEFVLFDLLGLGGPVFLDLLLCDLIGNQLPHDLPVILLPREPPVAREHVRPRTLCGQFEETEM